MKRLQAPILVGMVVGGVAMLSWLEPGSALGQGKKKGGEVNTPPAKGERIPDRLKVGDPAPEFSLPLLGGNKEVQLSSFKGQKPVVLIFASYT